MSALRPSAPLPLRSSAAPRPSDNCQLSIRSGIVAMVMKTTEMKNGLIEKKVLIQASASLVYRALTEAKDLLQWFCDRANSDPRVGGELKAYWKTAAQEGRAVFTKLEPNSAVELHWVDDGQSANAGLQSNHTLTYRIQAGRDCTVVTMSDQDSRAPDEETLALLGEGWNSVLLELKDYCERKERSAKRRHAVGSTLS